MTVSKSLSPTWILNVRDTSKDMTFNIPFNHAQAPKWQQTRQVQYMQI
jgi:hypothetical protein